MFKTWFVLAALCAVSVGVHAQQAPVLFNGSVEDGLGRPVAAAIITLTGTDAAAHTQSGADGRFRLSLPPGTYTLRARKASFADYTAVVQITAGTAPPRIRLALAPMQQQLVVTATGIATPQIQLGQSVQTLAGSAITARQGLTLDQTLRTLAGVQIVRDGALGGVTDLSLRGAGAGFTKILLDGVPVQRFDAGAYDFSTLLASAASVTVVSGGDSVVHGSDAAAGVIDIRTPSGAGVSSPTLVLDTSAGSFGTVRQQSQLLGQWRPFDYAVGFNYLDTRNQLPRDPAWNQSWTANLGVRLPRQASLRLALNRIGSRAGVPNEFAFFGIADNSWQREAETYGSLQWQQQTTANWHNQITLSRSAVNYTFVTAAPTGTPFDPFGFGANYLGHTVTITGANGYSVTGQAILDFSGTYPSHYASDTAADGVAAETVYALSLAWNIAAGYRFSHQRARTAPAEAWHSQGVFTELSGGAGERVFGSAGISEDLHSRFGPAFNPQASLAVLPRLSRAGWWDELRLHANASTGTKYPSIDQDAASLYQLARASGTPLPVTPVHPQRAHTFEAGADQYLAHDQARLSLSWFDDRYDDLIEFVPATAFPLLGLPRAAANAAQNEGGAYLNSLSESAHGVETGLDTRWGRWHARLNYTWLAPRVRRSFSSDAVGPAINPAFPAIPIGAYAPLVGARPFNVAPESGAVVAGYAAPRWAAEFSLVAMSRRDGSTFLSDPYFGNSMLLPNHDLAPAFATTSVSVTYALSPRVTLEAAVDNLLNHPYQEVFGYPALGRAARLGLRFTLSPAR